MKILRHTYGCSSCQSISPELMSSTACSSATSESSRLNCDRLLPKSKMASDTTPNPPFFSCSRLTAISPLRVSVSLSGSYRTAARKDMISIQQPFSRMIWSSQGSWTPVEDNKAQMIPVCMILIKAQKQGRTTIWLLSFKWSFEIPSTIKYLPKRLLTRLTRLQCPPL